jgi:sugar-specific transcriptional regulator TrmB
MHPNIQTFLERLGLTEKETQIYLAGLKYGAQTSSILAQRTGLARSTVNFVFSELIKKGFASKTQKGSSTTYTVVEPESLEYVINEKQAEVKKLNSDFQDLLPFLAGMQNAASSIPKVRYFEGLEGLRRTVDNCCESDETVYFISSHNNMHPEIRSYIEDIYIPRSQKHKNKNRMIINEGPQTDSYLKKAKNVYEEVLRVPANKLPFKLTTAIHGNTTLFISYDPEDMSGMIIENPLLAEHMRSIYTAIASSL